MKQNSTILFLESPGAISPVPLINGLPDFSIYREPTLSILQQSWKAFIDSGGVVDVIPDPEPIEIPAIPNWLRFYKTLKVSATFRDLMNLTVLAPNISGVMAAMGIAIQDGIRDPSDPDILPAFQASVDGVIAALNAINQPLSNEQLTEVRTLLDNNGFDNIQLGG